MIVQIPRAWRTAALGALASLALTACSAAQPSASAPTSAPAATEAPGSTEAAGLPTEAPAAAATEAPAAVATEAPAAAATEAPTAPVETAVPLPTVEPAGMAIAKLNLNEVSGEELLATIPGFSNRMVREFQEYRPYISIQQFRREIGKYVSPEQVAEYEQYVYVPIDVDAADEATVQQLPGVDAAMAAELIAGRPFGSNAAFLERLATLVNPEEAAAAAAYLSAE